jgi:hypothetical protein
VTCWIKFWLLGLAARPRKHERSYKRAARPPARRYRVFGRLECSEVVPRIERRGGNVLPSIARSPSLFLGDFETGHHPRHLTGGWWKGGHQPACTLRRPPSIAPPPAPVTPAAPPVPSLTRRDRLALPTACQQIAALANAPSAPGNPPSAEGKIGRFRWQLVVSRPGPERIETVRDGLPPGADFHLNPAFCLASPRDH